jgi:outer membrane protein OmpA-like peptidoglycan-associated protein/O6-methylguanine-DNA--protein-cysteine methyltransferase
VYAGRDRLREAIEDHFELLAAPGAQLRVDLRPGDVLLRRAPGTQMHIAVLGGGELLEPAAFARQGWTAEGRQPGRYAVVIEGGGCPHLRADNFARRVAADDGRLPANQMILRPLAQSDAAERLDTTSLLLGMTVAGGLARPAAPAEPAAPAKSAEPPELAAFQEGTEHQAAGACAKDLSTFGQQERTRELKAGRNARPQVVGGKPLCPGQLDLVQSGPDGGTIDLLLWNFDIDGAYPKIQHEAALDRLVFELHQRLRGATAKAANYTIFLSGFASRTGDVAYNRKLADEREAVVQNYLTAHLEQFKAAGEPAITANVVFDKNPGGFDPDAPPSIESPHSRSVRIVAVPAGKPPPPPRPFPVATIEIVLDDDNDTKVDGGSPVATFVRFGLWNHGYDAAGNIKNAEAERDNFIGNDSRRFYFRVKDGAAKSDVLTVRWSTLAADGKTADDEPAVRDITVQRVAAGKDVFVSKAVMLVTDETDVKQPTHSGLAAPHPDAGVRNRGQSNHRLRRARLDGFVKVEYQPVGDPEVSVSLPLFERGKSEERKRVKLRVINYGAKATVGEIAAQVTHANSRWNQIGYTIEAAATVDRPVPAAALDANGLYSGSANNPHEQAALTDLLPGVPDNTITVVFVPLTGANAYTTVGQRNTVALGDRFFVFMNTALDPNNETLAHELSHVLFNRFDDATAQRFFTLNTNPPVAFGVPLPDVRIYRRIQDQHTADPNNDAAHANVINWARRTRTARFPPEAGVGPAATATTGNKLSEAF